MLEASVVQQPGMTPGWFKTGGLSRNDRFPKNIACPYGVRSEKKRGGMKPLRGVGMLFKEPFVLAGYFPHEPFINKQDRAAGGSLGPSANSHVKHLAELFVK